MIIYSIDTYSSLYEQIKTETSLRLMKLKEVVDSLYDFMIKYYLHDAHSHTKTHHEPSLEDHENMLHHTLTM